MAIRTTIAAPIAEGATPRLTAELRDELGVIVSPTTCVATIYDEATGTIIAGRNRVSLLADGLNVITAGVLSWRLSTADTAIINSRVASEKRIVAIEWTWASGLAVGRAEIELVITNLATI